MVGIADLWIPIVLAAVTAFLASWLIHVVIGYHKGDLARLPGEENIMAALRKEGVDPGNYQFPHCGSMADMGKPEFIDKCRRGPVGMVAIVPSGPPSMGKALGTWFVYMLVIGFMVAYVAGRTLGPGAHYLQVFRVVGSVAFLAYAGAEPVASIWKGQRWSTTIKNVIDGLVYGALTAGVFGWLWPR